MPLIQKIKGKLMLLENRKWFQLMAGGIGLVAACLSFWIARSAFSVDASESAKFALALLMLGAISGFSRLLTIFLPLFLPKIFPSLDS